MSIFFGIISKIFVFILLGWLLQKAIHEKLEILEKIFINFIYYFIVPFFIFVSIVQTSVTISGAWRVIAASSTVVFGGGVVAYIFSKVVRAPYRDVVLPISVMNSAYLSIPVNTVLFGTEGAFWAIIYNITVTIIHFTVGVIVVKTNNGKSQWWDMPATYGLLLGFVVRYFFAGSAAMDALKEGYSAISSVVLPMMLIFMGMKISGLAVHRLRDVLLGVFFRMAGGFMIGLAAVKIFNLTGVAAGVCLVTSSAPPALNTYFVAKKFGVDYKFVAGMIIVGSLASIFTIPLIFWFVKISNI